MQQDEKQFNPFECKIVDGKLIKTDKDEAIKSWNEFFRNSFDAMVDNAFKEATEKYLLRLREGDIMAAITP